eukprot:superscaffoldBa00003703_g17519
MVGFFQFGMKSSWWNSEKHHGSTFQVSCIHAAIIKLIEEGWIVTHGHCSASMSELPTGGRACCNSTVDLGGFGGPQGDVEQLGQSMLIDELNLFLL